MPARPAHEIAGPAAGRTRNIKTTDIRTEVLKRLYAIRDSEGLSHYLTVVLAVAAVYMLLAKLGLELALTTKQISAVWPASGMVVALFLLKGYRYAPGVLLGALGINLLAQEPFLVASGIAAGNTMEGMAAAYLLRYFFPDGEVFGRMTNMLGFVILAALLSPVLAATIGVASLSLGGLINGSVQSAWLTWWIGDVVGILIVTPLVICWLNPAYRRAILYRPYESVLLCLTVLAVTLGVFSYAPNPHTNIALPPYLIFPLITWAAVRFRQIGVVTTALIVSVAATIATIRELGPFSFYDTPERSLIFLQVFMMVLVVTALVLSVSVYQHLLLEEAMKQKTFELQKSRIENLQGDKWRHSLEDQITDAREKITDILNDVMGNDKPSK